MISTPDDGYGWVWMLDTIEYGGSLSYASRIRLAGVYYQGPKSGDRTFALLLCALCLRIGCVSS